MDNSTNQTLKGAIGAPRLSEILPVPDRGEQLGVSIESSFNSPSSVVFKAPKPQSVDVHFENVPHDLQILPHWVVWRYERREARNGQEGEWTKPLFQPNGRHAQVNAPATWNDFEKVSQAYLSGGFDGIGFVLSSQDAFTGVDLDDVRDAQTGELSTDAKAVIALLDSYTEISPSGRGVRIWTRGHLPEGERRNGKIEAYDGIGQKKGRYLTCTGRKIEGTPATINERSEALAQFHANYLAKSEKPQRGREKEREIPLCLSDSELLERAHKATNGPKFRALWSGDTSGHGDDSSKADAALCALLAYWTGKDAARMDAFFRASGLMRSKWDEQRGAATYGATTIEKAISLCGAVYDPTRSSATPVAQEATTEKGEKKSQGDVLLELARDNATIFRTFEDEFFATIERGHSLFTHRVRSVEFRQWLASLFYKTTGKTLNSSSATQSALDTLCGLNRERKEAAREVFNRVGATKDAIYYDLGDESGRVIEITSEGWNLVERAPIAFVRPRGMAPQVIPRRGGEIGNLRPFLNLASDGDFSLIVAFLASFFQPQGGRPHLALIGEQGTGKTGLTTTLRALLDPNQAATRKEPRDSHDLMIAAQNNALLAYDNLSHLSQWLSDDFCRLTTGAGDATRQLYSDDEEKIFALKRPVIFNAIHEVATRPDLLDRVLLLELPIIGESHRRGESSLKREFEEQKPFILGALFDAVASGLKHSPSILLENLTRMADFETWAVACGFAFGWDRKHFQALYRENRAGVLDAAAESSTLVTAIEAWMEGRNFWEGSAQELLTALNLKATSEIQKAPDWPANSKSLGNSLKRQAPVLRTRGLDASQKDSDGKPFKSNGKRLWKVRRL